MPSLFVVLFYYKLFVACRLCVIYVGGDNDFNVQAMITRLMWTIWTSLSAVRERPLNLITHSLTSKLPYFSKNLKSWWMPASLSECKSSILCLIFTMGIPWKVVFWYWDRFQFIDFLSFVAMTACNSYRRCHMPCHIGHADFVQEHIRWWSGWRFIQCCPPVGGVKQIR